MLRLFIVVAVALAVGCAGESTPEPAPVADTWSGPGQPLPAKPAPAEDPALYLRDITAWANLDAAAPGFGLTFVDFDDDGYDDLVVPGYGGGTVYRNPGDGAFYPFNTVSHPGVDGGFAYALEVTGDGRPDVLYLGGTGSGDAPDSILSGDGALLSVGDDGVITAWPTLLPPTEPGVFSSVATFADFDADGALDLYLGRMGSQSIGTHGAEDLLGAPDLLLMRAGGQFLDATGLMGLTSSVATLAAMTVDLNDDGRVDLIVGSDKSARPDELFLNETDAFVERGQTLGIDQDTDAMGIDAADIDGDGDLDLLITDHAPNVLYVRGDGGVFDDQATERGLGDMPGAVGWGAGFHDFDHDGDEDLFVVNGQACTGCSGDQENALYLNDGTGHFTRVIPPEGSGLAVLRNSRAVVFADVEHDGDLDVLISNIDEAPTLLRNDMAAGHWLQLLLRHPQLDPPVGAKVRLVAGERTLRRWVKGTPSFGGSSTRWVHFGLADATVADTVVITWPDGHEQTLTTVAADQHLEVFYDGPATARSDLTPPPPSTCAAVCAHLEACGLLGEFGVDDTATCEADCGVEPFAPYTGTCLATAACEALERCELFTPE